MSISNQQKFFEAIESWQQSGLSQKSWCEQNDVAYHAFHYWYRRYRHQQFSTPSSMENSFVRIRVQDRHSGTPWCELVLPSGSKLFFHQPVAATFIKSLLD